MEAPWSSWQGCDHLHEEQGIEISLTNLSLGFGGEGYGSYSPAQADGPCSLHQESHRKACKQGAWVIRVFFIEQTHPNNPS